MLPETGPDEEFRDAVINQLPIWELIDRLAAEGIVTHHYAYRPGWVTLEISWYMAHNVWGHAVTATLVKEALTGHADKQGYVFNHWHVIPPKKELWTETLDNAANEAKVFLRTFVIELQGETALHQMVREVSKVNTNILAKSFKTMEKEGQHDRD